jgi:hypothetical protein
VKEFSGPVYYAAGELSNPRFYGRMADRAARLFDDCTVEVFTGRHHFDPPHRAEPVRLARGLTELWERGEQSPGVLRTEQDVRSSERC